MPAVLLWDRYELRPAARAINPYAVRVWTKMPPSGETISTMPAGDVTFGYNQIALGKTSDVIANPIHNPHKFMTNYHRHRNRFLCPCVPVIDVHVRAADGCFKTRMSTSLPPTFGTGTCSSQRPGSA